MNAQRCLAPTVLLLFATACDAAEVRVERTDGGATVTIDGQPVAEYRVKSGHQPVIWPIIGPGGQAMTRQHPLGPPLPGEKEDHPHQRSLWFNHGMVNGRDFWKESSVNAAATQSEQIVHRDFVEIASGDVGMIVTRNDWKSGNENICEDVRTIVFRADEHGRWIDFAVELVASESDVTFGDTKEGAFGLRVAGTMNVDAKKGGRILNSRRHADEAAWGRSAEWVDYRGPVDGKPVGITVFDMPDSFRHPTRWHVRTYGLFAANPFGQADFPTDDHTQGEVTLKRGEKLRLHYCVLFYAGERSPAQLTDIYANIRSKLRR